MKKFLMLLSFFALIGCSGGGGSGDVPVVAGIYAITEGTQVVTDTWSEETERDLVGLYFIVNQNEKVVTIFDCGAALHANEDDTFTFSLDTCVGYGLDASGGPGFFFTEGKAVFHGESVGAQLKVVGSYPWVGYEFSVEYDFQAKLAEDFMADSPPACPNCD